MTNHPAITLDPMIADLCKTEGITAGENTGNDQEQIMPVILYSFSSSK
jgi:hypothetical protein